MSKATDALLSERDFQQVVVDMARWSGWELIYHTFDSRKSAAGFPDLVMVRGGFMLCAELKTQKGKVTPEQLRWHGALLLVEDNSRKAVKAVIWRPSDLDEIERVLQRDRHPVVRRG